MLAKDAKFDIGEFAYFMHKNKVEYRAIYEMKIIKTQPIMYRFFNDNTGKYFPFIMQDLVYATKEDLLISL